MIDAYLRGATDLDDHAIHLLFSANRWEKAFVFPLRTPGTGQKSWHFFPLT